MCRCFQSIFESCYWHCYGKWKFDEDIALYEDDTINSKKSTDRSVDNLAFWDSVHVIANRSVILVQPSPSKLSLQDPEILNNLNIESKDVPDSSKIVNTNMNLTDEEKYLKIPDTGNEKEQKNKFRKKSAVEEMIVRRTPNAEEKARKKSLKERRNSTADLTLNLTQKFEPDFHEIPIIRQESIPKFYLNSTPEYNPFAESTVLTSPVIPQTPQFDLKSIVQVQNQIKSEQASHPKRSSSKIVHLRQKIKPILKKNPSTKSLPDTINYI